MYEVRSAYTQFGHFHFLLLPFVTSTSFREIFIIINNNQLLVICKTSRMRYKGFERHSMFQIAVTAMWKVPRGVRTKVSSITH